MKVLSVDDDQDILLVLSAALTALGYDKLTSVSSGEAALKAIEDAETPFDCFLLDIQMPKMDGVELCAQIRSIPQYKFAPIIMLTAKSDGDSLDHAFSAGATDYVTKPFDLNDLDERLSKAKKGVQKSETAVASAQPIETSSVMSNGIDMLAPLQLLNVAGMVSALALHNYLDQLYRSGAGEAQAVCLRVNNAKDLQRELAPGDFYHMLSEVAEAIHVNQKDNIRLMSYCGAGDMIVILHNTSNMDASGIEADIQSHLENVRKSGELSLAHSVGCRAGHPVNINDYPNEPNALLSAAIAAVS